MNNNLINYLTIFTCGLALLMGISQVIKSRSINSILPAIIFICLGYSQFRFITNGYINIFNIEITLPLLTVIIITGITSYLFFILLTEPEIEFNKNHLKLYLVSIPAVIIDIFIVISGHIIQSNRLIHIIINIIHAAGGTVLITSLIISMIRLFSIMNFKQMSFPGKFIFTVSIYSIIAILPGLSGLTLPGTILPVISSVLFSILTIMLYLVSNKHPGLLNQFAEEVIKTKYQKSMLTGINKTKLKEDLVNLLVNKRLYILEDCTLPFLARQIGLTSNQLSEFLNNDLGINYSTFINKYRIDEAKRLLIKNNNLSILDIAFTVGFGNKTSFNEAFLKLTGTTPLKYRKQHNLY